MEWNNETNKKAKKYRIRRMGYEFKSCSWVCYHKAWAIFPIDEQRHFYPAEKQNKTPFAAFMITVFPMTWKISDFT